MINRYIANLNNYSFNHCLPEKSDIKEVLNIIENDDDRICFLVDENNLLLKVISDGDIRRAFLLGSDLNDLAKDIHNRKPIVAHEGQSFEEIESLFSKRINIVPVLDKAGRIINVLRQRDVIPFLDIKSREIAVIGLGYVGLTLGLVMADRGFSVIGCDVNKELIKKLILREPPFYEKGLENYLNAHTGHNFRPVFDSSELDADVYIISVGTPIEKNTLRPNKDAVVSAVETVARQLKSNDLVIMRSTLPIGCTRKVIIPILENISGLKAGEEFFISVCPERTIEGQALEELKTLPQIVGGFDSKSRELSMRLFNENTHTVVDIGSLEAAEMCKLMDNTYRDLRFAFSNQMAILSEDLGLNLKDLIHKLNLAYDRNDIPYPSPGVGGACLSKDPYILYNNFVERGLDGELIRKAREINEEAPNNIYSRSKSSMDEVDKDLKTSKVFIIGFAFKGDPETSDLRESTTLWFLDRLKKQGVEKIWGYDPVVDKNEIASLGIKYCSLEKGFADADAVFFMNNHRSYSKLNISRLITKMNTPALFFDAWQIFDPLYISSHIGIIYKSVGKA